MIRNASSIVCAAVAVWHWVQSLIAGDGLSLLWCAAIVAFIHNVNWKEN